MENNKRLVHDLSKCDEVEYFIINYDLHFLREHLKGLSENREYLYEPARRMLIKLNEVKTLVDNPDLLI